MGRTRSRLRKRGQPARCRTARITLGRSGYTAIGYTDARDFIEQTVVIATTEEVHREARAMPQATGDLLRPKPTRSDNDRRGLLLFHQLVETGAADTDALDELDRGITKLLAHFLDPRRMRIDAKNIKSDARFEKLLSSRIGVRNWSQSSKRGPSFLPLGHDDRDMPNCFETISSAMPLMTRRDAKLCSKV
jgi:hypothetical protein